MTHGFLLQTFTWAGRLTLFSGFGIPFPWRVDSWRNFVRLDFTREKQFYLVSKEASRCRLIKNSFFFFLTECSSENGKCNKAEIRGITFSLLLSITIIFLLEAALLKYSLIYFVEEPIQAKMTGTPSQWLSRGGVSHWWKGNQPFSLSGTVWWLRTGVTATAVGFLRDCRPVSSPVLLQRVFMAAELNCGSPHVATSWSL